MGRSGSSIRCVFVKQCWTAEFFLLLYKLLKCSVREQLDFQGLKCVHRYLFGSLVTAVCFLHVLELLWDQIGCPSPPSGTGGSTLRCSKAHLQNTEKPATSLLHLLFRGSTQALSCLGKLWGSSMDLALLHYITDWLLSSYHEVYA